jgi:hypothetical protein
MPKIKSKPISGTEIREKPGVVLSLTATPAVNRSPTSSSTYDADNNLSIKILQVTSEAYAKFNARRAQLSKSPPPRRKPKNRADRDRETSVGASSASGMDEREGDYKSHRHFVQEMLEKGEFKDVQPGIACQICGVRKTGQWRRGPQGPRSLCNVRPAF